MQSKDPNTRASGALNHPDAAQWMGFLYGEIAPEKKRELTAHLVGCAACANQIQTWRSTMKELEAKLKPDYFQRIHRSTIVNVDMIEKISSHINGEYFLILKDGSRLKMSRNYKDRIRLIV